MQSVEEVDLEKKAGAGARGEFPPGPGVWERVLNRTFLATDSPEFYRENFRRFGDLCSFWTPNGFRQFQFNHPKLIEDVLVRDAGKHVRGVVLRRARAILGDGLLTSEEPLHLRQRRLCQPAFHRARLAGYGRDMVRLTTEMTREWERQAGEPLEIHAEMVKLTLRITSRCLLSSDVLPSVQTFVDSMTTFNDYLPIALLPGAALLEKLPVGPMIGMKRSLQALDDLIYGIIAERRRAGVAGEDLLGMMLEATEIPDDGTVPDRMSDKQVRDEALTLLMAGHETTANGLTFALWLVAQQTEVQEQMRAEIREVCGDRLPEASDYARLDFVHRCFAEAMRLYPPAWVVARTATEDYTMRTGEFIPEGSHLIMSQLVVHHDPRWWPEPMRFDPGRFTEAERAKRPRLAYFPFGGGARFCIGEGFAWMEGVLMLATVLQKWRLRLPDPQQVSVPITPKFTIRPREAVPILAERL